MSCYCKLGVSYYFPLLRLFSVELLHGYTTGITQPISDTSKDSKIYIMCISDVKHVVVNSCSIRHAVILENVFKIYYLQRLRSDDFPVLCNTIYIQSRAVERVTCTYWKSESSIFCEVCFIMPLTLCSSHCCFIFIKRH